MTVSGAKIVSAYAQTVDLRGLENPDIGQVMYRFDNGASAILESVWCMPEKTPFDVDERLSVIGSKGFVHVQETFPNFGLCTEEGFRSPDTTYWPKLHGRMAGALLEEFRYFTDCCLAGIRPTITTPEASMAALEATMAAEKSAATGQVVYL